MTTRLSPAELHTLQGQPPRQLSLFKSRRQRGSLPPPAPEFDIQCMVVEDLRRFGHPDWIWGHPASGERRDIVTAARLKRMGVNRGFPDLLLWDELGRSYFLELKRSGATLSDAQQVIADKCRNRPHITHAVAYSYQEARRILIAWGALRGIA